MTRRLVIGSNEAGASGGGGPTPPNQVPGLSLWLRADQGIAFGSMVTLVHSGSGPAATDVTWTGTPIASMQLITLAITASGTVGVSTFTYQINAGAPSAPQATGSAITIPGTGGMAVTFAAGSYVSGDTYIAVPTVASWTSIDGSATVFTQATVADQPAWLFEVAALNNTPSLLFNGTSQQLSAAFAAFSQPFTAFVVGQITGSPAGQGELLSLGTSELVTDATNELVAYAGAEAAIAGMSLTSPFAGSALFNGASSRTPANNLALCNLSTGAGTGVVYIGGVGSDYFEGYIPELVIDELGLSVAQSTGLLLYLQSRYAL